MGNDMGNNHTSAIKEEDTISEAEKKTNLEDTSELANEISQDVHEDIGKEENQSIPTSTANDVIEEASKASNDMTNELGKDTKEDGNVEDVKGKTQLVTTTEAKDEDSQEKPTSMLENDSLEGDTQACDENMENQMCPIVEAEHFQEKDTGLASEDATTELGKVTLQEDRDECDVKEKVQMIPTAKDKDVQEKATRIISNNTASILENGPLEGDGCESDKNMENQMHPTDEVEDFQEKATGMDSDFSRSSLENDSFEDVHEDDVSVDHQNHQMDEGRDDQIEERLDFNDKTSEFEDKKDGNVEIPIANGTNVQGKTTTSVFEDPLNLSNDFEGAVDDITEVTQSEKSLNAGSVEVEGENSESLSSSSLEGTEEYEKQEESCIGKHLSLTYNHHLDNKPSIKQDEEETMVLTLNAVNMSNGSDLQESSSVRSNHDEEVKLLSEQSLLQESSSVHSNPLNFAHEENCKALYEESKLSRNGSTTENSHDIKPDQCAKDSPKEYKSGMVNTCDMTIGSNGEYNGERKIVLDSGVSGVTNIDQVEEPKFPENGLQFDGYLNKASDESSAASEQKHSVVSEAETDFLIAGLTVVDCTHEEGKNYKNKVEETNEKPEASYAMVKAFEGTEMSKQCNSDLVTINHEESFHLQNSSSLLHIYDYHQDNVKKTNASKSFGTNIDNLDSPTAPSVDLVDDEAFEKEGEDYSPRIDTDSSATMSIEPCSNSSTFANGGYETRDSVTRLSTESNTDNPNISCQIQKSPSFNLNLRTEARHEESDQTPLLHQDKSENKCLENQTSLNLINSMPHAEYEEMPVEEKIVTMERSYSKKSKDSFIGLLKEEEALPLVKPETPQGNHIGKKIEKEVSSTSSKGKEKRKPRSYFFSSFMCCATVEN